MLREPEPLYEVLPPFRERVGTDDPAALLPYLERTPDAAEHYLFSDAAFEAEYDGILKDALVRRLDEEEEFEDDLEADYENGENDDELNEEDENAGKKTK